MIDSIKDINRASIRRICGVLGLPRSSYYQGGRATTIQVEDREIGRQIETIFHRHRRRYGYRRIYDDLQDLGITCAPSRVRRIMKQRGLRAISPRNFVPRTSDGRADRPSPNLLLERESPRRVNEIWTGDVTFIPTSEGWRYLAVVIDLYSRRVVGWSLASHLRSELVCDALAKALRSRRGAVNSSSTATVAASMAARHSGVFWGRRASLRACRGGQIHTTTRGRNRSWEP